MSRDENESIPREPLPSPALPSGPALSPETILSYEMPQSPAESSGSPPLVGGDLRVPWGWVDLLLLTFLWCGIRVLNVLFAVLIQSLGIHWSTTGKAYFVIFDQLLISLLILGYLMAQVRFRFGMPFWRTIGWRGLNIEAPSRRVVYLGLISSGFLLSILIQLASGVVGTKAKLPIEMFFQERRTALLLMLMSVLLAPLFEETVFRGYIYPVVARSFGVGASILATGTLFGLLHAEQLWGGWGQIGLLIVVGIVFTWVRALTKTVVASYLLHLSYNSFLFVAFLTASHGLRSLPH
ncbi:MAG TPA: type II CAAX endopeptidase family protein [Candidatus Acidoferrum sp.]|nr:type II CAAX endopeptidase family protein [Candidatus Acidoferrum sp.]